MPCCVAINCSSKHGRDNCRLFRFPANKERRAKWIQNTLRMYWTPTSSSRLCEKHFEDSQFEKNRADGWKKLKPNAVPTLFEMPESESDIYLSSLQCSSITEVCRRKYLTESNIENHVIDKNNQHDETNNFNLHIKKEISDDSAFFKEEPNDNNIEVVSTSEYFIDIKDLLFIKQEKQDPLEINNLHINKEISDGSAFIKEEPNDNNIDVMSTSGYPIKIKDSLFIKQEKQDPLEIKMGGSDLLNEFNSEYGIKNFEETDKNIEKSYVLETVDLHTNIGNIHSNKLKCELCSYCTGTSSSLKLHLLTSHRENAINDLNVHRVSSNQQKSDFLNKKHIEQNDLNTLKCT